MKRPTLPDPPIQQLRLIPQPRKLEVQLNSPRQQGGVQSLLKVSILVLALSVGYIGTLPVDSESREEPMKAPICRQVDSMGIGGIVSLEFILASLDQ